MKLMKIAFALSVMPLFFSVFLSVALASASEFEPHVLVRVEGGFACLGTIGTNEQGEKTLSFDSSDSFCSLLEILGPDSIDSKYVEVLEEHQYARAGGVLGFGKTLFMVGDSVAIPVSAVDGKKLKNGKDSCAGRIEKIYNGYAKITYPDFFYLHLENGEKVKCEEFASALVSLEKLISLETRED